MKRIAVFCGSGSNVDELYKVLALLVGETIATFNYGLIHGGVDMGLMSHLNKGCIQHNGYTIGIVPEIFKEYCFKKEEISESIIVKDLSSRKNLIFSMASMILLLPGGFGSLDEFFDCLTRVQVGLGNKKIIVFNKDGYFDSLQAMLEKMYSAKFCKKNDLLLCDWVTSIEELKTILSHDFNG